MEIITVLLAPNLRALRALQVLIWGLACNLQSIGLGRGVNKKGFKLAMVKMCSTWPLLNKYALSKILKWVFRPHHYLRPPIYRLYSRHIALARRTKIGNLQYLTFRKETIESHLEYCKILMTIRNSFKRDIKFKMLKFTD